ncbi:two-component system activity regulator YycH [Aminipila terrae]|uniref:Regulatory protein YycH domain-containing protein n=1 Tax=Aminipila terrae TaxID=2697030 RepID=A0A6P1MGH8_9FIRM|nr:two-component system activity regulator YycH [Aminipila terrae]QHI72283.1 hypothetical protein Ami3637_07590 [Aminipila terrae]
MEKTQINIIEKFKNILLVVLVFTTILLLYFLWGSKSLEAFIFSDDSESYEVLTSEKVLTPDEVILGRGNEDYIVATSKKEELWNNEILGTFRNFSQETNILVEEITKEKYKAAMKYPSIIARFQYDMPFSEFCDRFNINQQQGYDNISNLTEIGFSKGSKESAFIYDGSKKKYYWLLGNKDLQIFKKVDDISAQQAATYFPLKTYLGTESTNQTLIPVESPEAIVPIDYKRDSETGEKEAAESMAQSYFGKTLDFTRKIEESNGKIIYMYGYGQKVLIINPKDGSIEYKEEIKGNNSEQKSMFESLDTALTFISHHGGFKTAEGEKIEPNLESVSAIDDKKGCYRFIFDFKIGKNRLFYEENAPVTIDVKDGQVSYFRRELINFDGNQIQKKSNQERISAMNMLAMNYNYILTKSGMEDKQEPKAISFEDVANKIENLYTGYLKPAVEQQNEGTVYKEKKLQLVPVWVVEVNGVFLYFDLYDGKPEGYSKAY